MTSLYRLQKKWGIVLLSHTVSRTVPSPRQGLTSEFGLGSGVSPALLTPQTVNYELLRRYLKFGSHFTETFLIEKASYNFILFTY